MSSPSAEHATFTLERRLKAPVRRVFRAWAEPASKRQWFACHEDWALLDYALDFRVGGSERNQVADSDGVLHAYEARYIDIVADARIVFAYDMYVDDAKISVSLTTVEIAPRAGGTRLTFTEQDVFLDGFDDAGGRERGTAELLDRLGEALAKQPQGA